MNLPCLANPPQSMRARLFGPFVSTGELRAALENLEAWGVPVQTVLVANLATRTFYDASPAEVKGEFGALGTAERAVIIAKEPPCASCATF